MSNLEIGSQDYISWTLGTGYNWSVLGGWLISKVFFILLAGELGYGLDNALAWDQEFSSGKLLEHIFSHSSSRHLGRGEQGAGNWQVLGQALMRASLRRACLLADPVRCGRVTHVVVIVRRRRSNVCGEELRILYERGRRREVEIEWELLRIGSFGGKTHSFEKAC